MWKNLCELWDNVHSNNLHIIGVPEGEGREKGTEIVLREIIPDKSHIWWDLGIQVHGANRSPLRVHSKWSSPRHTVYNQAKENFRSIKIKANAHKIEIPLRISVDFWEETCQARRGRDDIFKLMNLPARNTFFRKVVFQKWRQEKDFPKQITVEGVHQHRFVLQGCWSDFFKLNEGC